MSSTPPGLISRSLPNEDRKELLLPLSRSHGSCDYPMLLMHAEHRRGYRYLLVQQMRPSTLAIVLEDWYSVYGKAAPSPGTTFYLQTAEGA